MSKLHLTVGSGKMSHMVSVNTSTKGNTFCEKMAKNPNSICSKCYATRYENLRPNLKQAFDKNLILLDKDYEPEFLNHRIVRLHSFGELHNKTHFMNFIKLARFNVGTTFALWTKRKEIVQRYLNEGGTIPSNLVLIYSNPKVDKGIKKAPKGFDKVFNVHSKAGAIKSGTAINCGAKDCFGCQLCYSKNTTDVINEKLK